jgi:hypothetical protein
MEEGFTTNIQTFGPITAVTKNRNKLQKHEIRIELKEIEKQKEIDLFNEANKSKKNKLNSTYDKYDKPEQKEKTLVENIMTNNLITNNMFVNMFSKENLISLLRIPTKFDEINYYSKWWRFYDLCVTVLNVLVILLAIYDYELNFSYPRKHVNDYNIVRILMILISITAIFCVVKRHYHKQQWKNIKILGRKGLVNYKYNYKSFNNEDDDEEVDDFLFQESLLLGGKVTKFFRAGLVYDIIINLIIPYPRLDFSMYSIELDRDVNGYIQVEYLFSDILYICIILRSIYIIRSTINYSIFTDHYANMLSKDLGVKNNVRFALKCILKFYHIKIVFLFFLGSVIIFGHALRVFERPFWASKGQMEFDFPTNSFWVIFVSMLTIGYGDLVPMTIFGKIVVVIASLWGVFICSLVVVCLYGLFDLSSDQFMVFIKIIKSRTAIRFIEDVYKFRKTKLSNKKKSEAVKDDYNTLISSFTEFKNMRNESKSIYRSNGLLYYNMKLLKGMKKINQRFDKIELDIEALTGS